MANVVTTPTLELAFVGKGPAAQLDKVVFCHPQLQQPRISIRTDSGRRALSFGSFRWDRAIQGMALLLCSYVERSLRKQHLHQEALPDRYFSTFAIAALNKECCLDELFGKTSDGHQLSKELFEIKQQGLRYLVAISDKVLSSQQITLLMDEAVISQPEEINNLIERIKLNFTRKPPTRVGAPKVTPLTITTNRQPTIIDEIRHAWSAEMPAKLLSTVAPQEEPVPFEQLVSQVVAEASKVARDIVIHLFQHTMYYILNDNFDVRQSYKFEIINAGLRPILSRTHQFWFECPQEQLVFRCLSGSGEELRYELTKSLPNHYQINLLLPRPLQPLEKFSYEVSFQAAMNRNKTPHFVALTPRTVTKRLKFTLIGPYSFNFRDATVTHETRDGFLRDDPPQVTITSSATEQRLDWECESPQPGEVLRTFWSDSLAYLEGQKRESKQDQLNNDDTSPLHT